MENICNTPAMTALLLLPDIASPAGERGQPGGGGGLGHHRPGSEELGPAAGPVPGTDPAPVLLQRAVQYLVTADPHAGALQQSTVAGEVVSLLTWTQTLLGES